MCRMSNARALRLSLEDQGLDGQTARWTDGHWAGGPVSRQTVSQGWKGLVLGTEHGFEGKIGFPEMDFELEAEVLGLKQSSFLHLFVPVL